MNKEFVVIGDKVVVLDDDELQEPIEYQDNIKEVLKQENRIEEIKKQLNKIEPLIKSHNKKGRFGLYSCIIISLVTFLLFQLTGSFVSNIAMSTGINLSSFLLFFEVSVFGMSAIPILIYMHCDSLDKSDERLCKGRKSECEYLSQELQKEKEKLKELQEDNKKERIFENQNSVVEIEEDQVFLENLKNKKDLYYELGSKMDKYQKLFQKGKLREELSKTHNKDDVIFIEDIVSDESHKRLQYTKKNSN